MQAPSTIGQRISPERADKFLERLVNLSPPRARPGEDERTFAPFRAFGDLLPNDLPEELSWQRLQRWRDDLRMCWHGKLRDRRMVVARLIKIYQGELFVAELEKDLGFDLEKTPPIEALIKSVTGSVLGQHREPGMIASQMDYGPFLQVLYRAWEIAPKMRLCRNRACEHPFFIAGRKTQKYCSNPCAAPAKRAAKLRWWVRVGNKRRRKAIALREAKLRRPIKSIGPLRKPRREGER